MPDSRSSSGQVERVLALRTFQGFAKLAPAQLAVLAEVAHERFFRRGTALSTPGQPVTAIHMIRRGKVNILREGVAVRTLGAGDVVGGIAAMTRDRSGQHLVAGEDTETFEISIDDMEEVFEDSYPILLAVTRALARTVLRTRLHIQGTAGFEAPIVESVRPTAELTLVERIVFVRNLMAYGRAKVEALAELALEMEQQAHAAGAVLWERGEPSAFSYLIASGVVRCETDAGHVFRLGPDSVVGSIDSMAEVPRWFRAVCETEVIALRSDVAHLIDVIEDHPDMGIDMLRVLATVLSHLQRRLDDEKLASERSGDSAMAS